LNDLYLAKSYHGYSLTDNQKKAIDEGRAWLLVTGEPNHYLLVKLTDSDEERSLFIWHANGVGWEGVMDTLDNIARSAGATSIKFGTSRRGWERRAKDYGFEQEKIVYSRRVE
jgi:hypothetical protein